MNGKSENASGHAPAPKREQANGGFTRKTFRALRRPSSLLLVAALLAVVLRPSAAVADGQHDYDNASLFYADLQQVGEPGNVHSAQVVAYVDAVADMTEGVEWCPIGDVGRLQEVDAVQKYMGEHRELWSLPARKLIVSGLKAGFPCTK